MGYATNDGGSDEEITVILVKVDDMTKHYPIDFTLESGTKVTVDKQSDERYDFTLTHQDKPASCFTYIDDGRPKAEWDNKLGFEELEALRKFWLITEEVV